jgi:hypothetical protein
VYRLPSAVTAGGTCLRGDDSLVVKKEIFEPLIVLKDSDGFGSSPDSAVNDLSGQQILNTISHERTKQRQKKENNMHDRRLAARAVNSSPPPSANS